MLFCYSNFTEIVILLLQFYRKCYFVIPILQEMLFCYSNLRKCFKASSENI